MKMNHLFIASAALLTLTALNTLPTTAFAADSSVKTTGEVTFKENNDTTGPVDPVDPTKPVKPVNPITPTKGPLSIDYASSFHFGEQKISAKDETYYANLDQVFAANGTDKVDTPNWVQVTDKRGTNAGWKLQVQQGSQLATSGKDSKQLKGAEIKLINNVIKTTSDNQSAAPTGSKEISLVPGTTGTAGAAQDVMTAQKDQGMGTWVDGFGDANSGAKSVSLTVPGASEKVKDVHYSTELTWLLTDTVI